MANHQDNLSVYGSPKNGLAVAMAAWQGKVRVSAVPSKANQHTIHAYFNTSPESPDGRWVLYFASVTSEGHVGDIHIVGTSRPVRLGFSLETSPSKTLIGPPANSGAQVDDRWCFMTAKTGNGWWLR